MQLRFNMKRMSVDKTGGCRPHKLFFILFLAIVSAPILSNAEHRDYASMKGHLKPFGESGTLLTIMEADGQYPEAPDFLKEHVTQAKPLKLKGLVKDSVAVSRWTDDYLLTVDAPADSTVNLETAKKENRSLETTNIHFHEFLKIYNKTEHYMVDDVPPYLEPELNVPCILQCPEILDERLAKVLMWFSSGGTKSVVHSDALENLNCVIRGEKTFILVDPKYQDKIVLKEQGGYSDIDVDSVDLTKYPELADVVFYRVNVTAGDCFFIPYKWIHQVRSFGSNIAVNFWWRHKAVNKAKKDPDDVLCQQHQCNPGMTLDQLGLPEEGKTEIYDLLQELENQEHSFDSFSELIFEASGLESTSDVKRLIQELFETIDVNKDGVITNEDLGKTDETFLETLEELFFELSIAKNEEEEAHMKEYAEMMEKDRKDEL